MLSKSQVSFLKSLQHKKERKQSGLFLVEGYKSVIEFLNSRYPVEAVYHTASFDPKLLNLSRKINLYNISVTDVQKVSSLKTPQDVIALVQIPQHPMLNNQKLKQKFSLVLDGVQDPGNMGTIIRTADWFGITDVICSEDTVDAYNPKVVQASMGSLSRINVHYVDIENVLPQLGLPIYGAMLQGENIYSTQFGNEGLLVMGNEGNGVRPGIERLIDKPVTIPRLGKAESLNVGIATALFCAEISRNKLGKQ
ncbi:RNA methyltransferase [Mucilaginibacter sp. L3T2-6]|uniref:TrmH family RNA methyltransferase n=1 Tax=Mucilaginibacter sp. L3T2-6 TaxID=3062491 RepID=UPI002675A3C9|nr:RNA methyltransferase [Mucilaginibacter sp. L3T2-6]MDO3641133.1 RNA methyltransferase [Mucilaginibacter sp. L3T2-6]MDV6213391.1 RNA methyltransferase [Mucilaginibacter sp. L3T2-6]